MRIHFSGDVSRTSQTMNALAKRYGNHDVDDADVIVALGGDGFILHTIHENICNNIPIYGINCGNIGFLTNVGDFDNLLDKISSAVPSVLRPLFMEAIDAKGKVYQAFALNEVYLLRETHQAAKLKIKISGITRLEEMIGDGIIVSTPVGSTAYNLSAHGPIVPIGASLFTLTPISTFRPRRWRGALLRDLETVEIEVLEPAKRPVCAVADYLEFREIIKVSVKKDSVRSVTLLFDSDAKLEDKVLNEQFLS